MDHLEKVLDYYFHPFSPVKIFNGDLKTSITLDLEDELLLEHNVDYIVEVLNYYGILKDNIAPQVGEILATQVLDSNIKKRVLRHTNSKSNLLKISGKSGYTINSSNNYTAKLTEDHNVVILKKGEYEYDRKFGFKVISEIDGLYMVKRPSLNGKMKKVFYAIETKTGTTAIDKKHIFKDIIIPLRDMYNAEINYVMIGFESKIYKDQKNQIFSNNIRDIYNYLDKKQVKFFPLAFPFDENKFSNFVTSINKKRTGWDIAKYAVYNKKENILKMILSDGSEVYGKMSDIN